MVIGHIYEPLLYIIGILATMLSIVNAGIGLTILIVIFGMVSLIPKLWPFKRKR